MCNHEIYVINAINVPTDHASLVRTTFWTDSCSYSGHPITFLWSTSNWRLHDNYCHERKWGFIITTIVSKDWDVIVSTATAGVTWVRRKWRKFGRVTCDHYATLRHISCPFHIWPHLRTAYIIFLNPYKRKLPNFRFLWPCMVRKVWREKTNKMQQLDVYY